MSSSVEPPDDSVSFATVFANVFSFASPTSGRWERSD